MIDSDDVGYVAVFGSISLLVVVIIWYLIFSVPEIEQCHAKGGQIVRIEGEDKCMDTSALKELK